MDVLKNKASVYQVGHCLSSPILGCNNQQNQARWSYLQFKKFLTIDYVPRITDFCICVYVFGCKLSLFRSYGSEFGVTPVDDITIWITWATFCLHIARISFTSYYYYYYCCCCCCCCCCFTAMAAEVVVQMPLNPPFHYNHSLKKSAKSLSFISSPKGNKLLVFNARLFVPNFALMLMWSGGCHVALKIHLAFELIY